MISYFRKIRRSLLSPRPSSSQDGRVAPFSFRAGRYLLYAAGEIILVVFGILIALQVNNWNEKSKQKRQVETYALGIISDLEEDIEAVKFSKLQAQRDVLVIDSLLNYTRHLEIEDASNLILYMLSKHTSYRPHLWHRAALEEAKSSGVLRYFRDENLINKILAYESLTQHLDIDNENDLTRAQLAVEKMRGVVNENYTNSAELLSIHLDHAQDTVYMIDFGHTPSYQKALAEDHQALSDLEAAESAARSPSCAPIELTRKR